MAGHDSSAKAPETKGSVIRMAWAYDAFAKLVTLGQDGAARRATLEAAAIRPGERILDIGCGTGTLAIMAKAATRESGEVHGVDASPEMVEIARRKASKARVDAQFQVGLIEKLPFPDAHFDLVLSSFMLHHLPDDLKQQGFVEIARVLKPGGRLLAADLSGRTGFTALGVMLFLSRHKMPAHYLERLTALIEKSGLAPERAGADEGAYAFITARKGGA